MNQQQQSHPLRMNSRLSHPGGVGLKCILPAPKFHPRFYCCKITTEEHNKYEGCSNMNASSFITFFTYMLRQNVIPFLRELFVAFKMAPNIKKHLLFFSSYRPLYKSRSFSEANCNTRFGACADIVPYLCRFETK